MTGYPYDLPERIWAVSVDTVGAKRISCSPLDHGDEYTSYVRADLVERLSDALRAQIYEHGVVAEDAIDILDVMDALASEARE
mgnify:CR=1 FL=1